MERRHGSPTICTQNSVVMPHDRKCPPGGRGQGGAGGRHFRYPRAAASFAVAQLAAVTLCSAGGCPRWSQPPPPSPCLAPAWPGLGRARGEWGARTRQVRAGGTRALGAVAAASLAVLDARALEASSGHGAIAGLPGLSLDGSELQLHELDLPGP